MMQLIRLAAPNTTRWGIRGDEERNKSDLARNLEAKKRDHAVFKEKNSTSGDEINSLEDKTIYKPVRRTIGRLRGGWNDTEKAFKSIENESPGTTERRLTRLRGEKRIDRD